MARPSKYYKVQAGHRVAITVTPDVIDFKVRIEVNSSAMEMFLTRDFLLRLRDQITVTCEKPVGLI